MTHISQYPLPERYTEIDTFIQISHFQAKVMQPKLSSLFKIIDSARDYQYPVIPTSTEHKIKFHTVVLLYDNKRRK